MSLAVLVVDPQLGWLEPNPEVLGIFHLVAHVLDRTDAWKKTVVTVFENGPDSSFRRNLGWWDGFRTGADTGVLDLFAHRDVPTFHRQTYNLPPSVWKHLEGRGVTDLLLTGTETDATILCAAMDAFDRGLGAWVVPELVASTFGEPGQAAGLAVLHKVLGDDHIISLAQAELRLGTSV